jgi:hypothetical protein
MSTLCEKTNHEKLSDWFFWSFSFPLIKMIIKSHRLSVLPRNKLIFILSSSYLHFLSRKILKKMVNIGKVRKNCFFGKFCYWAHLRALNENWIQQTNFFLQSINGHFRFKLPNFSIRNISDFSEEMFYLTLKGRSITLKLSSL